MDLVRWMDQGAEGAVAGLHRPWLDAVLIGVTHLGDQLTLMAVMLLAVALLLARRLRRTALVVALASLAGFPLSDTVKVVIDRPRPDVPWRVIPLPSSASFPSGHALGSMAVYGVLALTVGQWPRSRRLRTAAAALGLGLPLLIGFSRVYLGVHYLSDVLAGWAAGLALALLAGWADRRWGDPRPGRNPPFSEREGRLE